MKTITEQIADVVSEMQDLLDSGDPAKFRYIQEWKERLEALSVGVWLPIDSAPRDGTEYLGYDAKRNKFDVCLFVDSHVGHTSTQSDGEYGPHPDEFQEPSHWTLLPDPPKRPQGDIE